MAVKKASTAAESGAITITGIDVGVVTCLIKGTSPLIFNRMAEKAKRELLLPKGRKTAADKAQNLKHDPIQEFRSSVYQRDAAIGGPTRLILPSPAFKGAMSTAALETPGAKKAQVGRLVWIEGTHVDVYGVPELLMSVVRSADMNRTPDIRTRAILREWACAINVRYAQPTLNRTAIATLLAAAGIIVGVGDFRQEKGKGNYGQFTLVNQDDEGMLRIMKGGGRKEQDEALEAALPYDAESAEMLEWYTAEVARRGRKEAA